MPGILESISLRRECSALFIPQLQSKSSTNPACEGNYFTVFQEQHKEAEEPPKRHTAKLATEAGRALTVSLGAREAA